MPLVDCRTIAIIGASINVDPAFHFFSFNCVCGLADCCLKPSLKNGSAEVLLRWRPNANDSVAQKKAACIRLNTGGRRIVDDGLLACVSSSYDRWNSIAAALLSASLKLNALRPETVMLPPSCWLSVLRASVRVPFSTT